MALAQMQLRMPCDLTSQLRLAVLALLQHAAHPRREAVVPGRRRADSSARGGHPRRRMI